MKLPRKIVTKKEKKKVTKKKFSVILIIIGLLLIVVPLFYFALLEDKPIYINPLAKDQTSKNMQIEKMLKSKNIEFISVSTANDLSYVIKLNNESEVIIDPNKDLAQQLSSLQLITSQLKIEGKAFKSLDFRYKKPIIKIL